VPLEIRGCCRESFFFFALGVVVRDGSGFNLDGEIVVQKVNGGYGT
jgi:hypothetical protein